MAVTAVLIMQLAGTLIGAALSSDTSVHNSYPGLSHLRLTHTVLGLGSTVRVRSCRLE